METLRDEVIVLREWFDSDLDFVLTARQDALSQRFLAGAPTPFTRADARRYLDFDQRRPLAFAIADASSREALGSIWMDRDRGVAEIGYWLAPSSRGHGYASRAVRLLTEWALASGEPVIEICTHTDNHAAQAVAERCGFESAGSVENYTTWPDGSKVAARYVRRGPLIAGSLDPLMTHKYHTAIPH